MSCYKEKYRDYLERYCKWKLPLTRVWNDEQRNILTNHRSIAGISSDQKHFSYTPVAESFDGAKFMDIDGNEYIDITMGFGVHMFGHNPKFISEAIASVNQGSWGLGPYYDEMRKLALSIRSLTGVERLSFFNTGTEAIMVAIRTARAFTQKNKIVVFKGAYNGHNDSTLVFKTDPMSGLPLALIPGVPMSSQADSILLDFNSPASIEFIRLHQNEIAAVLTEPVQSRNPGCHPAQFLHDLRDVTNEGNIVLIIDEIITGFRIAPGGAQKYFGVTGDLVTYGKVIGGGMPIGILGGKSSIMDLIDGGEWKFEDESLPKSRKTFIAGTFCNHPLSVAAANAVASKLLEEGENICHGLNQLTANFVYDLNTWMSHHKIGISCAHFGSLFRLEVPSTAKLFFHHLLLEGLYVWEGKTSFFSTAHKAVEITEVTKIIKKCALLMKASGYFQTALTQTEEGTVQCAEKHEINVSMNIGVAIKIDGFIDPDMLEMAFKYTVLSEESLYHRITPDIVVRKEVTHLSQLDPLLQKFIDEEKGCCGFGLLMVFSNGNLLCYAMVSDRRVVDGWSMKILLMRSLNVYHCLRKGIKLPDFPVSNLLGVQPNKNELAEIRVSPMSKVSYSENIDYESLRKAARNLGVSTLEYLSELFAISFREIFEPNADEVIIGSPFATTERRGHKEQIGSFTVIDSHRYHFDKNYPSQRPRRSQRVSDGARPNLILNLDKIESPISGEGFLLRPVAIDPSYIRYDIVINLMIGGPDGLLIDIKWRSDFYQESLMHSFARYLLQVLTNNNVFVQTHRQ
ncbi:aminotransferase class III-fold pyridoxal phosphate-dependent enzyme [Mariniradius sediminis]|uniref:Aminotransferase class III-fold pyridoxal phosphate-dependent enzyme n=1 Tax=Mariniradius sediminis TaxID=2909237 RepID=A0ABS9BTA5_9BACT|nr:aminotransferase class III-fold pyridoxal phosphate-dependent enzyme [Mariniradius sediminis]MCF1750922.1 aminotransferase class III-fold pyridoxal phosphate-dependent enzyme [Mariniradius sediminis]